VACIERGYGFVIMSPAVLPRRKKSAWGSLGRHVRDFFIGAFPLEILTERRLVLRLRTRSEISVYHNIFVERVYPLARYRDVLGPTTTPVVFDAGANTGMFAAAVFDHWPQAQVHSFEPQPKLIPRIHEMAALNGLQDRHHINWSAIGESNGEAEFFQNRNPISASLLRDKAARRTIRRVDRVPVMTLDEYAKSHAVERVDLLKLDVEGVEIEALRGAVNVLRTVRLLFIEVHPPFSTYSAAKELLTRAGFVCASPSPEPDDETQANCVFIRKS